MASVILDLDYQNFPQVIEGLDDYNRAYILVRLKGRPVAAFWVPVSAGVIKRADLHASLKKVIDKDFLKNWLELYLDHENESADEKRVSPSTIAICTRNRPDVLRNCLNAMLQLPDDGQELLVIDSCSRNEDTRNVTEAYPGVRYVRVEFPGLNRARNRALQEALHPIVAFCDDDAQPETGWLRALTSHFYDPSVLCVTGLTLPIELETEAQEWFERYSPFSRGFKLRIFDKKSIHPLGVGRVGAGANMALRRDIVSQVGRFDEALDAGTPTLSGGDTEMFSRILVSGYRIVYEPRALSWHRHRRDWRELRKTIYGYGKGTYAFWTKKLLYEREFSVLYLASIWLFFYQLPAVLRSIFRLPEHFPLDILLSELVGCITGPWAYIHSRRQTKTFYLDS